MDDAEKMVERVSRAIMNESRNHLGAWPPKDVADLLARAALEAAGVERLREALKEAMDWNWLDDDMPEDVIDCCEAALALHQPEAT